MRITILAVGSRGDAQPYTALGMGLQQAGHEVKIATHEVFREMVTERRLEFGLIRLNPQDMLKQEAGQAWLEAGKNPLRFARHMARTFAPLLHEMLTDCLHASEGSDLVLISPLAVGALPVPQKVGAQAMLVSLWANLPTHDYPSQFAPTLPFGGPLAGAYNQLTYEAAIAIKRLFGRPIWQAIDRWQHEVLKAEPIPADQLRRRMLAGEWPMLAGYSPSVFPRPSDWPQWVHVTGYWFLDAEPSWQPPVTLVDFLQSGPAPVYIGFGSMAGRNPQQRGEIAVQALEQSGQRGVLLTGWGGLQPHDLPHSVLAVDSVPHDWLFPRMAAVVHHGGAGTTAAGLRAGKPTVIAPFFGDQPFWGRRVAELRVGPDPIPQKRLSVENLVGAIRLAVGDQAMHRRAEELSQQIRAEDGIGRAVELVDRFAAGQRKVFTAKAAGETVPGAAHRFEWEGS